MKEKDVPQDDGKVFQKGSRELYYALDDKGEFTKVLSTGWKAKDIAQDYTLDMLQAEIDQAKEDYRNGKISPILYFLRLRRMDLGVLSGYTGFWRWTIKRHMNPKIFNNLKKDQLQKYAEAFGITIEELRNPNQ